MAALLLFILVTTTVTASAALEVPFPRKTGGQDGDFGNQMYTGVLMQEVLPLPVREFLLLNQNPLGATQGQTYQDEGFQTCEDDMSELHAQLLKILSPAEPDPTSSWALQSKLRFLNES